VAAASTETTQHGLSSEEGIRFTFSASTSTLGDVALSENVELSSLNLRYEDYRLRDAAGEARVLASIAERGIEEPLEGVDTPGERFLLDGFKRRRSACLLYTSPSPRDATLSRMPSSA